ncbi:riboflavin synthase [Desulfobacter postgatei]|uniref:riboflavin synthase n=1 Tax=Desulfobacter postgatei TaxID=2293 RepID=UPI002A35E982|nr:riboflavin synthase [Desulfobacter postgatei]MDX9964471.1 riboflavin synthase [Desulfobacter postgatei]
MFTGIIESLGTIRRIETQGEGKILVIACDLDLTGTGIGDSIAVNGACLTAVSLGKGQFKVDMAPETVSRTTFDSLGPGARVNIERALKLSDRIDGHLVSGHIDGTGVIAKIETRSNAIIYDIQVPENLACEMIEKGSVAIDGISLTINQCWENGFSVSIIPHTAKITTIGFKNVGDRVNIETDMLGKYVKKFLSGQGKGAKSANDADADADLDISMSFLARNGFL